MSTNFIATSHKITLRTLSYQGIQVCDCFHQIREIVRTRLGDEYSLLFAEPSFHQDGNSVDWYSPVQGEVRQLCDLSVEEQNAIRASIAKMARDILHLADEIKGVGSSAQLTRGNILALALQYPDESCLYVIGGQPVFTCWGFAPGTPGVAPQELMRLGLVSAMAAPAAPEPKPEPAPEPVPVAAAPVQELAPRRYSFWWWLLPFLLLLLLFLLLFGSYCGRPPLVAVPNFHMEMPCLPFGNTSDAKLAEEMDKLKAEEAQLHAALLGLDGQLEALAAQCVPPPPPPAPPAPPAPEPLVIPKSGNDLGFIKGQWLCDRGLVNASDKQPIVVIYEFDGKGHGRSIIRQQGRPDCEGAATAELSGDGVLRIQVAEQVCPNGKAYTAETIECRTGADNTADCLGKTKTGRDWGGSAPFYRIAK